MPDFVISTDDVPNILTMTSGVSITGPLSITVNDIEWLSVEQGARLSGPYSLALPPAPSSRVSVRYWDGSAWRETAFTVTRDMSQRIAFYTALLVSEG
jgi:hypothetical protein